MFTTITNNLKVPPKERLKKMPSYILGSALHNLGVVQMWAGKYEDSLENFLAAIRLRRRIMGPFHVVVAVR